MFDTTGREFARTPSGQFARLSPSVHTTPIGTTAELDRLTATLPYDPDGEPDAEAHAIAILTRCAARPLEEILPIVDQIAQQDDVWTFDLYADYLALRPVAVRMRDRHPKPRSGFTAADADRLVRPALRLPPAA